MGELLGRSVQNASEQHSVLNLKVAMQKGIENIEDTVQGQVDHVNSQMEILSGNLAHKQTIISNGIQNLY